MTYVIGIAISYLLGSVPFGLLLTKLAGKGDLRRIGSGNIGATNVMRAGGLKLAGLVWILDMAKAAAAACLGWCLAGEGFAAWCGFAVVIGHCYPVWLRFNGGKGNSSMFGVLLAVSPFSFVIVGIEWLLIALATGFSSAGAIAGFLVLPFLGFAIGVQVGWAFAATAILCLWRHRENIRRLIKGAESKIEWKWKK
ncbi:MAG: glycerol-3-phosphate 1-O-acyltransferase PlsY [Rickettsiales bacterium]|jgi:glycerol-3-phosphate acyltransferase PlsY|nr:glycerol-3-phosphate 1-O-acyltransferase PlsY [Rickettsiales bacterium]